MNAWHSREQQALQRLLSEAEANDAEYLTRLSLSGTINIDLNNKTEGGDNQHDRNFDT